MKKLGTWNPDAEVWITPSDGMFDLFASEHSEPYSETWPSSGSMRSGAAFEHPMLAPHIVASAYSSWRTGKTSTASTTPSDLLPSPVRADSDRGADYTRANRPLSGADDLATVAMHLPTPTVAQASSGYKVNNKGDLLLPGVIDELFPTPTVAIADGGQTSRSGARRDEPLLQGIAEDLTARLLPTPAATLMNDSESADEWQARADKWSHVYNNGTPLPIAVQRVDKTGEWGKYHDAVTRAQRATGRPAPPPTSEDGRPGRRRLSPRFVEWMMMLPEGWVVDVPAVSRRQALKALGNGVVPAQASAAMVVLLSRVRNELARGRESR